MIIYGSMLCPDCVECCADLDASGISYEFREITANLQYMKEFLKIRDTDEVFEQVKKDGKIGIPCVLNADGNVSLAWK